MHPFLKEFISEEKRDYKFKVGSRYASALAGFVCGAIFAALTIAGTVLIVYLFELSMM